MRSISQRMFKNFDNRLSLNGKSKNECKKLKVFLLVKLNISK